MSLWKNVKAAAALGAMTMLPLNSVAVAQTSTPVRAAAPADEANEQLYGNDLLIVIAVVVAAIGAGAYFLFFKDDDSVSP